MDELVTGDAVVLGLRPARLPTRALAFAVDAVAVATVYVVIVLALVLGTGSLDAAAVAALQVAAVVLVVVGGPIAVETLSRGRSLGKMACGLRVVRDDGGPIRFRHALVRGTVGVVELLVSFSVIACVASLVSARGRRIGDVFAGTLVVRERTPAARFETVPPPPAALAGAFSGLDLSSVPDGLWLAVRQYLTRMGQLDASVSWSVAARLADDVSARTGAPAPTGVPPAAYLAAVLQERQVRDARRAFGGGDAAPGAAPGGASAAFTSPGAAAPSAAPAAAPGAAADQSGRTAPGPFVPGPPPATGFVPPA